MQHTITVGDLVRPLLIIGGLLGLGGLLMFAIWLMNPFRGGH